MSPLYFVVGDDVHIDSEVFLVTDFVNLKIKSVQFLEVLIDIDYTYVYTFIGVSAYTCISIYVYIMF
jgi:hypothetical protein